MVNAYIYGEFVERDKITPKMVEEMVKKGKTIAKKLSQVSVHEIIEIINRASYILEDKDNELHNEIVKQLPQVVGFSEPMVEEGIKTLTDIMRRENVITRINVDLGKCEVLDEFTYNDYFKGYIKAQPRGLVAHISAGNVFVGAMDSLVQGLVTKNVNILKMSGNDTLFPLIFAKAISLADEKKRISDTFCLIPFRGGEKEIEEVLKTECNTIIVYGGENAVRAYKNGLGIHTNLVEYGPKYSCSVIDPMDKSESEIDEICDLLAKDFTMWDQSACSSPHTVFIKGRGNARKMFEILAKKMEEWRKKLPHGDISPDEAVEIIRTRELTRVEISLNEGEMRVPEDNSLGWTVVYEENPIFRVSCHHRTAFVKPVEDLYEVEEILKPYGEFIQTISIESDMKSKLTLGERLINLGADRITEIGMMSSRKHGTPHDGTKGLGELIRWVSMGTVETFKNEFDYFDENKRDEITLARLNMLLDFTKRNSPFYSERIRKTHLKSLDEISEIPILSQKEFRDNLPPYGNGIITDNLNHSYSFGSGGTTGKPKFVYRTVDETLRNAQALAKGLYLSGFKPEDTVANLLFAGNLWASFVSYNQALEKVGCHILPIAGNIDMELIMTYLKSFNANAAISIPSVILSIAEYVEENSVEGIKIEKISTGGEHLFKEAKEYISKILGTEKFISTGYTTNDTGAIGFQCECCSGGLHHIHEDIHIVEFIDPETGKNVKPGETGKVVVTNIDRYLMPVIRYDVGDMGRLVIRECECGRKVKLMELLGRSDDTLIIGGGNILLDSIAKAISDVEELSYHFRMVARIVDYKDQIIIDAETKDNLDELGMKDIENRLYDSLLHEKPEFLAFMKTGSIKKPVINILKPNTLPRNPRTGKIKQVIDERHT